MGPFPLRAHVLSFQISYYSFTIFLVSASSSCFTLAVPMREVSVVFHAPLSRDTSSLYSACSMVNVQVILSDAMPALSALYYRNNDSSHAYKRRSINYGPIYVHILSLSVFIFFCYSLMATEYIALTLLNLAV